MGQTNNVEAVDITGTFKIAKADEQSRIAFGWAYVSKGTDGRQIEDWSGDRVDINDLEKAAYEYVKLYRDGSEMHERGGVGTLVESMVFTKEKMAALGLPDGSVPLGWWCGIQVTDEGVWKKVKDGTYRMFSIEGEAKRIPITEG